MPSNRNEGEERARLLDQLFSSTPPAPAARPEPQRRTRRASTPSRTAATVATIMTAATATAPAPQPAQVFENSGATVSRSIGETVGMESREVRAIELCARKMELLALERAVQNELADLNQELERVKRSA